MTTPQIATDELLNEIVSLSIYENKIEDDCLFLTQDKHFIVIELNSITNIVSNDYTIKIKTPLVWITLYKAFNHTLVNIFAH